MGGFREVYETALPRLVRLAHLITGSNSAAEDVVHGVFVAAYRKWEKLEDPDGYQQANALADEARRTLGTNWLRVEFTVVDSSLAGYCYQPLIDLQFGAIFVIGMESPIVENPGTSTTLPPG